MITNDYARGTELSMNQPSAAMLAATPPKKASRGSKRTPSVEEEYGALVKAGFCRIVRKKGKPPVIVWLIK